MYINKNLINTKETKRLLIFKSNNLILKTKHFLEIKMNLLAKSLSGIISKIYFHISPLFTRVKHNLIFSTTSGHLHVVLIDFLFLAVYWNLNH